MSPLRWTVKSIRQLAAELVRNGHRVSVSTVRDLLHDNLKAVVDRADALNPRINPSFLEYAQARGFMVDPCVPGSPTPRVERAVPYCRHSRFAEEEFGDLLAARDGMRRGCLEEAGRRVHGTTRAGPGKVAPMTCSEAPLAASSLLSQPTTIKQS